MMYTFKINVPFWRSSIESETVSRIKNLSFVDYNLNQLTTYLQSKDINIRYEIFDFSIIPLTSINVTHIPVGVTGEFKKAEKLNRIIERTVEDIFIGWDADIVLRPVDFENFYELLSTLKIDNYYNSFNVKSLDVSQDEIDYKDYSTANFETLNGHMYTTYTLCLGGLFVIPTEYLKKVGGYNEAFTHRGGEDGEIHDRLKVQYGIERMPVVSFYGYHLPHEYHFYNKLYQKNN